MFAARIARAICACTLFALILLLTQSGSTAKGAAPNRLPIVPIPRTSQPATNLPASAGDWPMYGHDASRTGYNSAETTISAANVNQLVSRWQANVGMSEYPSSSSPAVSNGRVFVGSSASTGNNFFAFNSVTGSPLWGANLGYVNDCSLVGIGSSPVVSGTIVSVGGGDRAYYGLDAVSGQILYRNDMNVGYSGFAWSSPLMAYGRTYIGIASNCDAPSVRGELRALDMQSGQQLANQYFVPAGQAGAGIWSSPALSPDGATLVVVTGEDYRADNGPYNRAIVSLDPITLQIRQANQQGTLNQDQDFGSTPVFFSDSQGRVLVGANHKDDVFYAYEANNIAAGPIWQLAIGTDVGTMPSYDPTLGNGGTLFIAGQTGVDSTVYAVDPANGAIRWGPVPLAEFHGNMAVANGLIFINAGRDGVRVLDEATGNILRTIVPANVGTAFSGIAVANGFIYWLSGAYLNAWSLPGYIPPTDTPTVTGTPPTSTSTLTSTSTATGTPPTATATRTPTFTSTPGTPTGTPVCAPGWNIVTSPSAGPGNSPLQAVSAFVSDDIWSVGYSLNAGTNTYQTLAEFWNGSQWNTVQTPNVGSGDNFLLAVDDRAGNDAWAAGYYRSNGVAQTLTLHWDGASWSAVPSPNIGTSDNYLQGVVAIGNDDVWAVGYYRDGTESLTLTEHWDGTQWSVVSSPNTASGGALQAVAALTSDNVWAVGLTDATLVEHWDGTQWAIVPSPNAGLGRNALQSVVAIAPDDIWAVGYYRTGFVAVTLTEHWDGTQWSVVPSPVVGNGFCPLQSVTADSSHNVWAVGYFELGNLEQTLVLHWDGTQWDVEASPDAGGANNSLNGVVSISANELWAAGYYTFAGAQQPLIEHYIPTCVSPTPTSTPGPDSLLVGHVNWQGRPAQPNGLQQLPITLTLSAVGVGSFDFGPETTDPSGFFTVTVSDLPLGTYNWRSKDPKFLTASGVVPLSGSPQTGLEMGTVLAGDANNDNRINITDFNILRSTFSLACGLQGYDDRADFTGDCSVNVFDFNLLRNNFGRGGASPGGG